MLNSLKLIPLTICILLLSVPASRAVIQVVDVESSGFRLDLDNNITSGLVSTGSGAPGDFELLLCTAFSDGNNSFLDPTPGNWSTIDSGECGGNGGPCIFGVFGGSDNSASSTDISCNWTDPVSAFAAGLFRLRGVDRDNPVIAVACNTGIPGEVITAPSVDAEPNSFVIVGIGTSESIHSLN